MRVRWLDLDAVVPFLAIVFGAWCMTGVQAEDMMLENGYFRLLPTGSRITSFQVDPSGAGHYGPNWVLDMGFEGLVDTEQTQVIREADGLLITGLRAETKETIYIREGPVPVKLNPGHTLGQAFEIKRGRLVRLEVRIPTWHTSDSGATLSLRRGDPTGPILAQRRMENVQDNSWQELTFDSQGPGRYCVELSDAKGDIGWWCTRESKLPDAVAYADGQPVHNMERSLRAHWQRTLGTAEMELRASTSHLEVIGRLWPSPGGKPKQPPFVMTVRWDNDGYEVSQKTTPFFRFFTDTMRYMPVQQMKRWKEREGWYELRFGPCSWIEADGTGNHDLRFNGTALALRCHLRGKETTLSFSTQPDMAQDVMTSQLTLEALPRDDALPEDWPRFVLPDQGDTGAANTFFYERAFTYPPVWGGAAWHEWNALARVWQGGPHLDMLRNNWASYPISEEGYVHTWGDTPGWPFPRDAKYDTRHFDTNARFILACWRYAAWTGDMEFLKSQAERLRRAMHYQLTTLRGQDGLIVTASKDVNGRHQGIGDNYWDILPFGHLDAYANVVWYASLEAMAQIEEMLETGGGGEKEAPAYYRELGEKARRCYNETFWDKDQGRYIGCVDVDGKKHDYGFTFVNLEAMAYGLADKQQVERIYHWMETLPTSSGEPDTYSRWIFAPRANTIHNPRWNPNDGKLDAVPEEPWWFFGWHGTAYGDQCQDGGAILYTSFFDLMARTQYLGPGNAWRRWREIVERWRMPDHLCGGPPLYRGEHPQQVHPGAVGLDIPFPESGLVPCWLLYGLLGVQATSQGLEIAPRLPSGIPWLEAHNVQYHGLPLSIRAAAREVSVQCHSPGHELEWRGELGANGKATFTVPQAAGK